MSKVQASADLATIDEKDIRKYVTLVLQDIVDKVNGKLEFGVNIAGKFLSVTFSSADTSTTVSHGLGKMPTGYILVSSSVSMNIYDGGTPNTTSSIYLKSSATGTAKLLLF